MKRIQAIGYALAAALFYALSIPCAKLLLEQIAPTYAAALLYLGAGIGVGIMYLPHYRHEQASARIARKDLPYTVGIIVLDIAAPILLMIGVRTGIAAYRSLTCQYLYTEKRRGINEMLISRRLAFLVSLCDD